MVGVHPLGARQSQARARPALVPPPLGKKRRGKVSHARAHRASVVRGDGWLRKAVEQLLLLASVFHPLVAQALPQLPDWQGVDGPKGGLRYDEHLPERGRRHGRALLRARARRHRLVAGEVHGVAGGAGVAAIVGVGQPVRQRGISASPVGTLPLPWGLPTLCPCPVSDGRGGARPREARTASISGG